MKHSTKSLLACAALAGLYSGAITTRVAAATRADAGTKILKIADNSSDKASCNGKSGCSSKDKDSCKGVHDCKGKNDCKGQGGCKTANNDCKSKNDCKGKGGCSTAKKPDATTSAKG